MTEKSELQVNSTPSGLIHDMPMVVELGNEFGMAPKQIVNVLKNSIIKVPQGKPAATPAELVVVLSVMRQYKLNPMLKQLHAWRDNRGELAVMMGFDGWTQKANEQPGFMSVSYEYGPEVPSIDGKSKTCWEWVKATVHDSIRGDMVMFPTYLEEWYQQQRGSYAGPWQKQTRHKLHVVTYRLAIREAYSIGIDIRDPEDFSQRERDPGSATKAKLADMADDHHEGAFHDAEATIMPDEVSEPPEVPCGASGCPGAGKTKCVDCGSFFCDEHLSDSGSCQICGLDK